MKIPIFWSSGPTGVPYSALVIFFESFVPKLLEFQAAEGLTNELINIHMNAKKLTPSCTKLLWRGFEITEKAVATFIASIPFVQSLFEEDRSLLLEKNLRLCMQYIIACFFALSSPQDQLECLLGQSFQIQGSIILVLYFFRFMYVMNEYMMTCN